ncbi:MAG: SPOR domain-containing protein [Burkholderiales bacterium]|nr:SPOR domain-containing protein [Burkholderiales bacterium]OJX04700.1 MAG: hypothetical protein BGO72_13060 [Burkholderiales bacterium 70-64]
MARRDASDGAALDPALTQKKRARRRLVGAVVLGLAAAVILPLVLDSEPRQTITDVQIEIPPRDAPLPPKAGDAAGSAAASDPVPPATPSGPPPSAPANETSAAAPAQAPQHAPAGGPAEAPVIAAAPAARPTEVPPEASATSRPPKAAEAPAKATEVPPKAAEKQARAAEKSAAAKAEASRHADASKPSAHEGSKAAETRFALQVGAFANAGSARAQADQVRKAGVRTYTETVQTAQGSRTRVRVGPFPTREAAEQARAKLQLAGIASTVVTP